ncbi:MAG: DAK2 domain-containing protein [Ruminococcus sp.]|nr:DAK2 domain-containing protein [Ruminococcus sp.]
MSTLSLTGSMFRDSVKSGAANLDLHSSEVNDLNVFPIPDGDTGSNMTLTIQGGAGALSDGSSLSEAAACVSRGMLLSARGNSGVILSQLFEGLSEGFKGLDSASLDEIKAACRKAVTQAYSSVIDPTEGTILTVARETTEAIEAESFEDLEQMLSFAIGKAKVSLEHTPDKLDVLKKAGVVDSGGAGLIYILEGMLSCLTGKPVESSPDLSSIHASTSKTVNTELFTEDSVLEFGYCTEVLVRLQKIKCDPEKFDINTLISYMSTLGDSIVAFKNGTIVKLHVHTMSPYKVLEYCQHFGEFLTIKIENMMLQHSEVIAGEEAKKKDRSRYAVVAVASGDGLKQELLNMGADVIIDGGQTSNPSASDILAAFDKANADTVFILPNNGNILLTARQAGELYTKSEIRVIPTKTIGDCISVLSMLDLTLGSTDEIEQNMTDAMEGVVTAEISRSIRAAELGNITIEKGEYIGIIGKDVVSADTDILDTAVSSLKLMEPASHSALMIIEGKDAAKGISSELAAYAKKKYPRLEIYDIKGGQDIYELILVVS